MGSSADMDALKRTLMSDKHPMTSLISTTKDLLECKEIGATVYMKYRFELKKKFNGRKCHTPEIYSLACISLPWQALDRKIKDGCHISFHVLEDNGYAFNTILRPTTEVAKSFGNLFGTKVDKTKLQGKFHLEVLFVDAIHIGNQQLCQQYVEKINARFKDYPEATIKENIKKAEKWLESARKKKATETTETKNSAPADRSRIGTAHMGKLFRFPYEGKYESMFAERWYINYPMDAFRPETDREAVMGMYSIKMFEMIADRVTSKTHTLFEYRTFDGHLMASKLRPYAKNTEDMLAEDIRKHRLTNDSLIGCWTVTIYAVDVPAFAPAKNAASRLNVVRKALEKPFLLFDHMKLHYWMPVGTFMNKEKKYAVYDIQECTEPFDKKCDCQKVHLSDYCFFKELNQKNSRNIEMRSWSITPSALCIELYSPINSAADFYARIINRLSLNSFSKFGAGTNLQIEIEAGGKLCSTQLKHHSEFSIDNLSSQILSLDLLQMHKKITVTVYVVDIFKFAKNEDALKSLAIMKGTYNESDFVKEKEPTPEKKKSIVKEVIDDLEKTTITAKECKQVKSTKTTNVPSASEAEQIACTFNNSDFKAGSNTAIKASTQLINVKEAYKILSSKIKMNTTKSRILMFSVEPDSEIHTDVVDSSLLMAIICLDIVKTNEISLWAGKKKKITLKLSYGSTSIQVVLNEKDCWNPKVLKEDMFRQSNTTPEVGQQEDNMSCSEPCAKKSKDMETQMFLMQSTMMNMGNVISQLKESQKEIMELLKTLTNNKGSEVNVFEKLNKPENSHMKPSTPKTGLLKSTETSKKSTKDDSALKDSKNEKDIDSEDEVQIVLDKLQKSQDKMKADMEDSDNKNATKNTNNFKKAHTLTELTGTSLQKAETLKNSTTHISASSEPEKEKQTDPEDTLENWISYGLPDDPCAMRIILRNIEKYPTWKAVIGKKIGYTDDLTKWIKKNDLQQIIESKIDSFVDQLLKNYETIATVIEKAPAYYLLENETAVVFNYKIWQMMITSYINLEDAMKEKELPVYSIVKFTSKILLDIYNRVTDQTVCWRTQNMVYFISGSNREGDASERKKPAKYDRILARDAFNGSENKLKTKDAIEELVSMVKNEELKSDFLSSFWAFVTEKLNQSIKFEDVYEAVCYHFHTSIEDRQTLCNILDYLLMETNNPASIKFMLKNQVTRKITVELTKPSEPSTDESVEWLYANFLCRLLVKPKTVWEESEPNGAQNIHGS